MARAEDGVPKGSGLGEHPACGQSRSGGLCPRKGQSRHGYSSGLSLWDIFL